MNIQHIIILCFFISIKKIRPYSNDINELIDGEYYEKVQSPQSIMLYTINCTSSGKIYLKREKGSSLLYGYSTKNIDDFKITENDIIKLTYSGSLDTPYCIQTMSYLEYVNDNQGKKYVLIILCSDAVQCEYSIWFSEELSPPLKQNKKYIFYQMNKNPLTISLKDSIITEKSILKVYITPISGNIKLSFNKNGNEERPTKSIFSLNDIYYFQLNVDDNDTVFSIEYNTIVDSDIIISSFFIFTYVVEEEKNNIIYVENGLSEIYDIVNNKESIFIIEQSIFSELFYFALKAQNCILHLEEINNDEIINEYSTSFYQIIYSKNDNFRIKVRNQDKENESCKLIYYGFSNDSSQQVVILEGVEQKFIFNSNFDSFVLLYPIYYSFDLVQANINLYNTNEINVHFLFNNQKSFESRKQKINQNTTLFLNGDLDQ